MQGNYDIFALLDGTDCGEGITQDEWIAVVTQDGADVVVGTPFGEFQGTVSGSEVRVSGSFPDGLGYTTFTAFVFTVAQGVLQGSVEWTYSLNASGAPVVCSGTTDLDGERVFEVANFNLADATDVPLTAELVITFTKDVDPVTVSPATLRVVGPLGQVPVGAYIVAGNTVRFVPDAPGFEPLTDYAVHAVDLRATDGEILFSPADFDFTTGS